MLLLIGVNSKTRHYREGLLSLLMMIVSMVFALHDIVKNLLQLQQLCD